MSGVDFSKVNYKESMKNVNEHTGERLVTKHRDQDAYRAGFENIKWGVKDEANGAEAQETES